MDILLLWFLDRLREREASEPDDGGCFLFLSLNIYIDKLE